MNLFPGNGFFEKEREEHEENVPQPTGQ